MDLVWYIIWRNAIISVKATIPDVNQWHPLVCEPIPQFHDNVWTNFGKHHTAVIVLNQFHVQAKNGKAINTSNIIGELRIKTQTELTQYERIILVRQN